PAPVRCGDEVAFRHWCAAATPVLWPGQVNLRGLRPLLRAEFQWCLFAYTQRPRPGRWDLKWVQQLANLCRQRELNSLVDLDLASFSHYSASIARIMHQQLRLVYFTPADTRDAGFIETDHFGVRFPRRASHVDLTAVAQRWLRNLLWDYLADLLRSPSCPRTASPISDLRRGVIELGVFLELDAPAGGHDPTVLTDEHMQRFVADQRHRERDGLPSLATTGSDGKPSTVTTFTRSTVFNSVRRIMRDAMETGRADHLGLDRQFLTAMPAAGGTPLRARRPFPDEVAIALADDTNLTRLAEYDPHDRGLRDIWETIVTTGRRTSEVVTVRWDCLGRYGGLAMFWHDQTKVGNYDAAIRIPERLYDLLATRQTKTLDRYIARHGREPTGTERAAMALFPSNVSNIDGTVSLSSPWFQRLFKRWVDELDVGRWVPHQARHTLATSLLRHGATLTHIRRYLGHISERMAEHYVHLSHSDLEEVLHRVWVAGPGTANPGELLSSVDTVLTREQAQALAIDLSRRATPADGGFCTFQPVVDGGACPWNLDCHNCDKFVLSGADLLYWRRKGEQWRQLAEGAPDDATADYLHQHFEPTARAIAGLEQTLAGLGLLDDALALDLRKPQDYFHRVWSTAFAAADLADASSDDGEPAAIDGEGHP
ncbi:MAG: site-specific integrase, partial [Gemmatimonadota bacterium]